jgi:CBS domain containing-hemolysin-like protein
MTFILASCLLLLLAFVLTGLEAAWLALDPVRLRHRADKGQRRARQMLSWSAARPQADLALAWSSRVCAAASLVLLATALGSPASGAAWWVAPVVFIPVYALLVEVLARQVFRRLPFVVLSRLWWMASAAGSVWTLAARPAAGLLRRVPADPLPRPPAAEELEKLAAATEGVSALEQSMLRSVLNFRRLTAGGLALPVRQFPHAAADVTLGEMLAVRELADAELTLVLGPDGVPLGAMSCGSAALSGALSARAQSFARPLLSFTADLPAWNALVKLRRARTSVAEVREEESGRFLGVITEKSVVTRLLGQAV